eukprot:gnl/TRDRNA2_/TRDRNA2_160778_c1_seq4.p1 gnl/TRDRNA2_/TRDRNA2_160778_c1~~gnl/TRDRNA2_/TRDRNA2_160778_c1_seq4.p1  ORF type:complete len:142 (+),score=5.78 gnl/TRDRNA2_/TRDRNA2_160778_c1_seq4:22-447(+)
MPALNASSLLFVQMVHGSMSLQTPEGLLHSGFLMNNHAYTKAAQISTRISMLFFTCLNLVEAHGLGIQRRYKVGPVCRTILRPNRQHLCIEAREIYNRASPGNSLTSVLSLCLTLIRKGKRQNGKPPIADPTTDTSSHAQC